MNRKKPWGTTPVLASLNESQLANFHANRQWTDDNAKIRAENGASFSPYENQVPQE
jgi:hypothetical protein